MSFSQSNCKKGIQLRMFHSGHTLIRRPRHRHTRIYLIDQFTKKYCNPVCFGCAYTIYAYKLCNVLLHRNIFLFLLSIFMYVQCNLLFCVLFNSNKLQPQLVFV